MKKETVFIDEDTLTKEELEKIGDRQEERLEAFAKLQNDPEGTSDGKDE